MLLGAVVTAEIQSIERYLEETLGLTVRLSAWNASDRLPIYLRDGYRFYAAELLSMQCLFMVDRADEAPSPASVRKQMGQVEPKWNGELVYVRMQVASHQRKRLIEQRVPFLVPGNQMYLPMLGIDLREHFRKQREKPLTLLPATQALILHLLLHRDEKAQTPAELANRLGYAKMTMTRALNELEVEQLCDVSRKGRERWLRLKGTPRELWKAALPLLRSPVRQRNHVRWVNHEPIGHMAGLEALAKRSMLAPPNRPVFAVSADRWKKEQGHSTRLPANTDDPDAIEVEVWNYDPTLFSGRGVVDLLSLYLSLKDHEDERVQVALEEMMGGVQW
jgi:DNA-binding MarR family transcriptional regulator